MNRIRLIAIGFLSGLFIGSLVLYLFVIGLIPSPLTNQPLMVAVKAVKAETPFAGSWLYASDIEAMLTSINQNGNEITGNTISMTCTDIIGYYIPNTCTVGSNTFRGSVSGNNATIIYNNGTTGSLQLLSGGQLLIDRASPSVPATSQDYQNAIAHICAFANVNC